MEGDGILTRSDRAVEGDGRGASGVSLKSARKVADNVLENAFGHAGREVFNRRPRDG
jgi:hypothetical protein